MILKKLVYFFSALYVFDAAAAPMIHVSFLFLTAAYLGCLLELYVGNRIIGWIRHR